MKTFLLATAAAALLATPAFAEPRIRTQTFSGPNHEGTRTVTRDRAAGTFEKDATATRNSDGATATRSAERQRTETGISASGTSTGFGGRTSSYDYQRTRDGNGGFTANGTATNRRGETFTGTGSRMRTEDGFTSDRTIVNGAGATVYDRDASVSRQNGQINRSVDVTRAEGFGRPRAGNRPGRARRPRG